MLKKIKSILKIILNKFKGKYRKRYHNGKCVYLRRDSVDSEVFEYVFKDKYHRPFIELSENSTILDLGSNIGLSVIDLRQLYPDAKIFGYELDQANYNLARLNTKNYENVQIVNAGVWYSNSIVTYSGKDSDGFRISEINSLEKPMQSRTTTINDIVADNGIKKISYIKMDIEGAEFEIFEKGDLNWLNITEQMKIEVHYDDEIIKYLIDILIQHGFKAEKDSHHWSTIIAYK